MKLTNCWRSRERERESHNLIKKFIAKLFACKIASVFVEQKNNKKEYNLKDINNKKDRLFFYKEIACPF